MSFASWFSFAIAVLMLTKYAYALFIRYVRILTTSYFRRLRVVGINNLPRDGPVILSPNHCNMLMDPFLVVSECFVHGRSPYIWAKGALFQNWLTALVLRAIGAVPVYRPYKGPSSLEDKDTDLTTEQVIAANKRMFEHTWAVLGDGNAMVLFPEGTSYTQPKMLPFKTGVVRAATGFVQHYHQSVPIVPVGLTYTQKDTFRSDVVLEFGTPLVITPDDIASENFCTDERAQVKKWTDDLSEKMHQVTLNASSFEKIRAARAMQRLYLSTGALIADDMRGRFTQGIVDMMEKEMQDPAVQKDIVQVQTTVLQHEQMLMQLGLQSFEGNLNNEVKAWTYASVRERMLYWVLMLPLGIVGFAINAPFYYLGGKLDTATTDVESKSMVKMFAMGVCIPAQWIVLTLVAGLVGNSRYVAYAVGASLIILFFSHIRMMDETKWVVASVRLALFKLLHRQRFDALCAEHQALAKTVTSLVKQHVDPRIVASVQKSIEIAANSPKHAVNRTALPFRAFTSFATVSRTN